MSQGTNTREDISDIIKKWKKVEGSLVMMLHSVQKRLGYVPRWAAMEISKETGIALAKIYEVLTFYSFFKLTKPAKYQINVCIGTACYLKGAPELLKAIAKFDTDNRSCLAFAVMLVFDNFYHFAVFIFEN